MVCKKAGMISNLAPFDKEKARKCTFRELALVSTFTC